MIKRSVTNILVENMKRKAFNILELLYFLNNALPANFLWLNGRVLDSRPKGRGLASLCCVLYPCLVLVQPRKTRPDITENNQIKQIPAYVLSWNHKSSTVRVSVLETDWQSPSCY